MKSFQKMALVLDCFSPSEPRLALHDIATRTGLPGSTVHRLLAGLKEAGMIVQAGNRDTYRLGLRLLSLGGIVLADLDVPRHAREHAAILVNQSGESVHVCVFDGRNVVSVDRHEMAGSRNELIRLEREPPYCTGTGKAILAALSPETVAGLLTDDLKSFTANTITRKADLERELAAIRARGHAVDDEERQAGIRCVGAAIHHGARVVGAISLTGPATRFPHERIPVLANLVKIAAARIGLSITDG